MKKDIVRITVKVEKRKKITSTESVSVEIVIKEKKINVVTFVFLHAV